MPKSLFDHVKAITNEQNPKYFDTLEIGRASCRERV